MEWSGRPQRHRWLVWFPTLAQASPFRRVEMRFQIIRLIGPHVNVCRVIRFSVLSLQLRCCRWKMIMRYRWGTLYNSATQAVSTTPMVPDGPSADFLQRTSRDIGFRVSATRTRFSSSGFSRFSGHKLRSNRLRDYRLCGRGSHSRRFSSLSRCGTFLGSSFRRRLRIVLCLARRWCPRFSQQFLVRRLLSVSKRVATSNRTYRREISQLFLAPAGLHWSVIRLGRRTAGIRSCRCARWSPRQKRRCGFFSPNRGHDWARCPTDRGL
ncbi:hypothetical protein BDY21DRAFT_108646 [Lineolata rhizophorae]|uniref:Uncharacterized protein n=1 Tax=Lineolata rhizophorae TaxID=578093 RepID=A0A6A6NRE9_9PEZI|nr:hypothetical protein BDY21DRAFT_108646 [Lineolata rhizophorae]